MKKFISAAICIIIYLGFSYAENDYIFRDALNFKQTVLSNGEIAFNWSKCASPDFRYYKLVYSENDSDPYYHKSGSEGIWYSDQKSSTSVTLADIKNISSSNYKKISSSGTNYFRLCILMKDEKQYCSRVIKTGISNYKTNANSDNMEIDSQKAELINNTINQINTKNTLGKLSENSFSDIFNGEKVTDLNSLKQFLYQADINNIQLIKDMSEEIVINDSINQIEKNYLQVKDIIKLQIYLNTLSGYNTTLSKKTENIKKYSFHKSVVNNIENLSKKITVYISSLKKNQNNTKAATGQSIGSSDNVIKTSNNIVTGINNISGTGIQQHSTGNTDKGGISGTVNIQDTRNGVKNDISLTADITETLKGFGSSIIYAIVGVAVTSFLILFLIDILRSKFKSKINLKKEISRIIKNQSKIKFKTVYIHNFKNIYQNIERNGYKLSPEFLMNFIITLNSRGLVVLFGPNGVGKSSFAENFAKGVYPLTYQNHFLSVLIKENMDDEKKFVGLYDRLNNTYIDPQGVSRFITKAYFDRQNPYFLVLDEMNMQDIERYFPYFLNADKIINEGNSDLIKLGELSDSDSEEIKIKKLQTIRQNKFMTHFNQGIYEFGIKIPSNLFIIGTINIDDSVKIFSGKLLDRCDIIKFTYMGNKDYSKSEIPDIDIKIEIGKNTILETERDNFINEIDHEINISKRSTDSIGTYLEEIKKYKFKNISFVEQKIIPKISGDKESLVKLLGVCRKYQETLHIENTVKIIEKITDDEFTNYWK